MTEKIGSDIVSMNSENGLREGVRYLEIKRLEYLYLSLKKPKTHLVVLLQTIDHCIFNV